MFVPSVCSQCVQRGGSRRSIDQPTITPQSSLATYRQLDGRYTARALNGHHRPQRVDPAGQPPPAAAPRHLAAVRPLRLLTMAPHGGNKRVNPSSLYARGKRGMWSLVVVDVPAVWPSQAPAARWRAAAPSTRRSHGSWAWRTAPSPSTRRRPAVAPATARQQQTQLPV